MANKEHLAKLKEGVDAWNVWREKNPTIQPDLVGADLRGANLSGADLSDADLRGANLSVSDLFEAKLSGADLLGANLIEADLSEANFGGVNLSGANLRSASLVRANLKRANLSEADLTGVDLISLASRPILAFLRIGGTSALRPSQKHEKPGTHAKTSDENRYNRLLWPGSCAAPVTRQWAKGTGSSEKSGA